jgi:aldehyde dehydrogenase (NAD+)
MAALKKLQAALVEDEQKLFDALHEDLRKSPSESYMTELGIVREDLRHLIKHLPSWIKPQRRKTPLAQFPSKSYELASPYGLALILSPWNYPVQLSLAPLSGALAAGNCAILKPSAFSINTSHVLASIAAKCFAPEHVTVVEGGRMENQDLLAEKFDYIFFTGSAAVGKFVMESAARHLTPVSLELGGKSPCIVDRTAKLPLAAKRLAFGKILNAGQTCVAPDYLLVDKTVKAEFLKLLAAEMNAAFPEKNYENLPKIINEKHFKRVCSLIAKEKVYYGGEHDEATGKIFPTILDNCSLDDPIMQEEIFGPVLPVITYETLSEALGMIKAHPNPLALYLFSEDKDSQDRVLKGVSFGGGCVNDTIIHLATTHMGFGGVGESGMGSYHGKFSFDTFSHIKSIVDKSTLLDLPMRYHPYTKTYDKMIRFFVK